MIHNPNCDGDRCRCPVGQVRLLPLGKQAHHGNLILCFACWHHEIEWRKERNRSLARWCWFDLPQWTELKPYKP